MSSLLHQCWEIWPTANPPMMVWGQLLEPRPCSMTYSERKDKMEFPWNFWSLCAQISFLSRSVPGTFHSCSVFHLLLSCFSHVWLCAPHRRQPTRLPHPWDSPGKILQARTLEWVAISFSNAWKWKVKVKSLSRVRLLATPGSSVHGIFQARVLEWGAIPIPHQVWMSRLKAKRVECKIPRPAQESSPGFLHLRQILYHLNHQQAHR